MKREKAMTANEGKTKILCMVLQFFCKLKIMLKWEAKKKPEIVTWESAYAKISKNIGVQNYILSMMCQEWGRLKIYIRKQRA